MKPGFVFLSAAASVLVAGGIIYAVHYRHRQPIAEAKDSLRSSSMAMSWQAPDTSLIPAGPEGELIRYGRKLIAETSVYFGPKGKISHAENGMNCQNCHLKGGTSIYANPFSAVASLYPIFRARSGRLESIERRVNDCLERSLNGKKIDSSSREMKSMVAYLKWLGINVPRGFRPPGSGIIDLPLMNRAADTVRGTVLYLLKCQSCHGSEGQGLPNLDRSGYLYPPLWGPHAYNTSAGIYRLSRLAGFIKYAMPLGVKYPFAQLTNDQAWDLAAFINSKPHPVKFFKEDWPVLATKPFDYPFGPYADRFSEKQHRYGPFLSITEKKNIQPQK